ncbi:MAG: AEC family transporter [Thermodesulfobacteriota bacterium]
MISYAHVEIAILSLVALILGVVGLRRIGIFRESDGKLFSRIVTTITLPSLIFYSLAHTPIEWDLAILALFMLGAEIVCLALGWLAARALRLPRPQAGAFILASGFGSSALLGYALIGQVFPGNHLAVTEAVMISELGVGPALFTIGVMIAMFYGSGGSERQRFHEALAFFRSPIFISVVAGILWSVLRLPTQTPVLSPLFSALRACGQANTFCVALTVGLLLNFHDLKRDLLPGCLVSVNKLILKPVLIWLPSIPLSLTAMQTEVLILEASMPSAMLTVVLCETYGCDAKLASRLVFVTSVASMATVIVMFRLLA